MEIKFVTKERKIRGGGGDKEEEEIMEEEYEF